LVLENCAKDIISYSRFKDGSGREKEKHGVNCLEDELTSDDDAEIYMTEWVDTPKPISSAGRKDEIKYTFDVSTCDKLFDVLMKGV
jgi:hypothetical protein